MRTSIALLCCTLLSLSVMAENSTQTRGYTIHHNALTTDLLNPSVASEYGIQRSNSRGMVNISILRDEPNGLGEPQAGRVTLVARNLFGQFNEVPLREVREEQAIYYIADFPVADRQRLMFDIEVSLAGEPYPLKAQFEQEFYTR